MLVSAKNHSEDIVETWYGKPEPVVGCGFHTTYFLQDLFAAHAALMAEKKEPVLGYDIEGNYGQGWEAVTAENTRAEALATKRTYEENEPGIPFRIRREKEDA